MAAKSASRKRKLVSEDVEEASRKRGRPRVDKQDDSAADRRRTQIRLAQRAYRERKESTITTLQDEVVSLKDSVKKIQAALKQFNSLASQRGLQDLDARLAGKLSETLNLVTNLAQGDSSESTNDSPKTKSRTRSKDTDTGAVLSDPESLADATIPFPNGISTAWGYQMVDAAQTKSRSYSSDSGFESGSYSSNSPSDWGENSEPSETMTPQLVPESLNDISKTTDVIRSNPTLTLPNTRSSFPAVQLNPVPNVPYSFTFPEGSFSQRLHYLSLRRGLELLLSADSDPEMVKRKFYLPLQYATVEELRDRLVTRLSRPRTAALQSANHYPFIGWGGAGTHFSHLTLQGARPATRFSFNSGRAVDIPLECDLEGFEGEWFDPGDVEGYLMEKGINIQYNALYAEGEVKEELPFGDKVPDWSSGSDSLDSASGFFASPDSTPLLTDFNEADVVGDGAPLQQTRSWDMSSPDIFDTLVQPGADMDVESLFFDPSKKRYKTMKHITVDVQKLMDKLLDRAICLGREPGFRRHHVDEALQESVISVY